MRLVSSLEEGVNREPRQIYYIKDFFRLLSNTCHNNNLSESVEGITKSHKQMLYSDCIQSCDRVCTAHKKNRTRRCTASDRSANQQQSAAATEQDCDESITSIRSSRAITAVRLKSPEKNAISRERRSTPEQHEDQLVSR